MGILFFPADDDREGLEISEDEVTVWYTNRLLSALASKFSGEDKVCDNISDLWKCAGDGSYFRGRNEARALALLLSSNLDEEEKRNQATTFLKAVFPNQLLGDFSNAEFVVNAIKLTDCRYPYDFAPDAVKHHASVRLAVLALGSVAKDIAESIESQEVEQALKEQYPELMRLGGLNDPEFVKRAIRLTRCRYPYNYSTDRIKSNKDVILTVLGFVLKEEDYEGIRDAFMHEFDRRESMLGLVRRNITLLRFSGVSLRGDWDLLLHALVFGNWKPILEFERGKYDVLVQHAIHYFPYLVNSEIGSFLHDIVALHFDDDVKSPEFIHLKARHSGPAAEDEPQGVPFRMLKRALLYYKNGSGGVSGFFQGFNAHYKRAVDEALNKLCKAEADTTGLYKTEPQQLAFVSGIIQSLSEGSPEKGYKGKLSSVLIDLIIRLINYARDKIAELDGQQPQDERAASVSGAAAAEDDAVTEKDAWTEALSSLLTIKLTCREFKNPLAMTKRFGPEPEDEGKEMRNLSPPSPTP